MQFSKEMGMGGNEHSSVGYIELQPPSEVALENDHQLQLFPIGSHTIDIRHLPRPLSTTDEVLSGQERDGRDEYITMCEAAFSAVWHETASFVETTATDRDAELSDSALFDARLAYDELVQNAFRHGGRPQRLWVSVVRAIDFAPDMDIPQQHSRRPTFRKQPPQEVAPDGYRILLGIQDANPNWNEKSKPSDETLPENLRGLDIVRGVSKALWYQSNQTSSKWVWALI